MPDTTTLIYIAKIIALSPSWSMLSLVLGGGLLVVVGGIVWLLISLSGNTAITKKINDKILGIHENQAAADPTVLAELSTLVKNIRDDQIISNQERKLQALEIKEIIFRLDNLEFDFKQHIEANK